MEVPATGSIKKAYFHPPTDLVFAVIADVVHAHEDRQKFPVRLEVQILSRRQQRESDEVWGSIKSSVVECYRTS